MSSEPSPDTPGSPGADTPDTPGSPRADTPGSSGADTSTERWTELPPEVRSAADYAVELKAEDVTVLDVRHLSSATDFFVIGTGRSDIQVKAIAKHVIDSAKKNGFRPEHVEGLDQGRWVLIDYIDHVIHVFHPSVREFYQLETLWGDAPSIVPPQT